MKLFVIYITNNATAYGGEQSLRQAVLFVFVPFDKNTLGDIVGIYNEQKQHRAKDFARCYPYYIKNRGVGRRLLL